VVSNVQRARSRGMDMLFRPFDVKQVMCGCDTDIETGIKACVCLNYGEVFVLILIIPAIQ
jgi:hypothetical protein